MPDDDSDSDEVSEAEEVSAEEDGGEEDGGEEAEPAEPAKPAEPAAPLSFSERLQLTLEANLAKVSDLFRDWDKNADGLISRAEFTRARDGSNQVVAPSCFVASSWRCPHVGGGGPRPVGALPARGAGRPGLLSVERACVDSRGSVRLPRSFLRGASLHSAGFRTKRAWRRGRR